MRNANRGRKILVIFIVIALVAGILGCVAVYMHGKKAAKKTVMVKDGLSAYELAVQYGYEGTVEEWLDSLRGKSAYEIAVENGYSGTEDNWSASLKAAKGKDGVGIKTAAFSKNNELLITLTDSTVLNLGIANGLNGEDGANGKDGVGITAANINADGQLVISFSDGKSVNLDKVVGINGKDGIGVSSSEINASGELVITYTNGQNANLGVVVGAQGVQGDKGDKGENGEQGIQGEKGDKGDKGEQGETGIVGKDGVSVTKTEINNKGELVITLSDNSVSNLGVIVGAKGEKGDKGDTGVKGEKGEKGDSGIQGIRGEQGISVVGAEINSKGELVLIFSNNQRTNVGNVIGAKGEKGDKGETGAQGIQGVQGVKGDKGDVGAQGVAGKDGVSVIKTEINNKGELVITLSDNTVSNLGVVIGAKGDKGDKGDTGAQGIQGIQGEKGEKGDKGDTGAVGKDGEDGEDGTGIETIVIENGNLKITLTTGTTLDLGNIKGEKGDAGAQGVQGIQGEKGEKGETGANGLGVKSTTINMVGELVIVYSDDTEVNLGKVVGADGAKGEQGIQGIQGIQGEKGDKGDTGEKGDKGDTGTTGLGVKSTTINAAGELVIAYSDDTEVNLGKVIGADGAKGEQGIQGIQGVQGEKGDMGEKGEKGDTGVAGVGVAKVELKNDELVITLSDDTVINLGQIKGNKGDKGDTGESGVGITNVTITPEGNLMITFTTGNTIDLGNVKGANGRGVDEIKIENNILKIKYSDSDIFIELGNVKGEKGEKGDKGEPGRGIAKTEIINGHLWITYTDDPENAIDLGAIYEEQSADDFLYYELANGTYGVKLNPVKIDITVAEIPSVYKGKSITQINEGAFSDCTTIERLIIPDSIKVIEADAFNNCDNLQTIYYYGTLQQWNEIEFSNEFSNPCSNGAYLYIGRDYKLLTEMIVPETVTAIKQYAFYGCSSLTSVTLPNSVETIGDYSFSNCENLSNVQLSASVTAVNQYAFNKCTSLQKITIPGAVTFIGRYAFFQTGLTKVVFEKATKWTLSDGASFSFSYTYYASGYGTRTKTYTHNLSDSAEAAKALVDSVSVSYQYNDPAGGWPTSNFSGTRTFHWYQHDWSRNDN